MRVPSTVNSVLGLNLLLLSRIKAHFCVCLQSLRIRVQGCSVLLLFLHSRGINTDTQ